MGNNRKPSSCRGLKLDRKPLPPEQLTFWQDLFPSVAEEDCRSAAGWRNGTTSNNVGTNGNYWSSTLSSSNSNNARNLNFNDSNHNTNNNNRRNGQSVRPVTAFTSTQLLADLYKAYRCARLNKRSRVYQIRFEMNLEENLCLLCDELMNRTYRPGTCMTFIVYEPKQREVFAAPFRDRIVHHLYYNYTHKLFERTFIADTYSCIKNRGTHYGVNRLEHHIRSVSDNYNKECYVMKLDILGYFMSIDRQLLLNIVNNELTKQCNHVSDIPGITWGEKLDYNLLFFLNEIIILHNPVRNCVRKGKTEDWNGLPDSKSLFHSREGCGLPIGNLTSQLFSNVFLNCLDQYVKRTLKCPHYGRYVDDMYFVDNDKQRLKDICKHVSDYLQTRLYLRIHPDKVQIIDVRQGVEFLGQYVMPHRRYISNKSKRRINNGISCLASRDTLFSKQLQAVINSYAGILGHVSSRKYWTDVIQTNMWLFRFGVFDTDMHFHVYQ